MTSILSSKYYQDFSIGTKAGSGLVLGAIDLTCLPSNFKHLSIDSGMLCIHSSLPVLLATPL